MEGHNKILTVSGCNIVGENHTIYGNHNTISGQRHTIYGNRNIITGWSHSISGNRNLVSAWKCKVDGLNNIFVTENDKNILYEIKDRETDQEELQCTICMNNVKSVFLYCGHTFCAKCTLQFDTNCPLCNEPIEKINKLFL